MAEEFDSIRIESAENGFMVSCQYAPQKPKKGKKGEAQMPTWQEPERYVYESSAEVLKKVGQALGGLKKAAGSSGARRTLAEVGK